jgi:mRNA interferase MazF
MTACMLISMRSTSVRIDAATHDSSSALPPSSRRLWATPSRWPFGRFGRISSALSSQRSSVTTRSLGSLPTSGDVVDLDLGQPRGRDAGFRHPAVVVTAQRILDTDPFVVHVVPLTSNLRRFHSEVTMEPDVTNGLDTRSAAQCQHIRAISPRQILEVRGNIGAAMLAQLRETIAGILDLP